MNELNPNASPQTRVLARRMLGNYYSIDKCSDCEGQGWFPDYSGCGDSSGGWADTCQECRGRGYIHLNPELKRKRDQEAYDKRMSDLDMLAAELTAQEAG